MFELRRKFGIYILAALPYCPSFYVHIALLVVVICEWERRHVFFNVINISFIIKVDHVYHVVTCELGSK